MATYKMVRGYRNKNPGNIRKSRDDWQGLDSPRDDGEFFRFREHKYGIRAAAKIILNYQRLHGVYNIAGIIKRWAPASDNNHTDNYIKFVSDATGIPAYQPIKFENHLRDILAAIFRFENGFLMYSTSEIQKGIDLV